jgi:hypothetical protein
MVLGHGQENKQAAKRCKTTDRHHRCGYAETVKEDLKNITH